MGRDLGMSLNRGRGKGRSKERGRNSNCFVHAEVEAQEATIRRLNSAESSVLHQVLTVSPHLFPAQAVVCMWNRPV